MSDDDRKILGARLKDAREYLNLSQDEAAKAVGITRSAISLVESGQRKVSALELKRFAELYRKQAAEFTGEVDVDAILPDRIQHLARAASKLTESDQAELLRFAEFLSIRSPVKEGS